MGKFEETIDSMKKAVCMLQVEDKLGTAFFVKKNILISAGHLFEEEDLNRLFSAKLVSEKTFDVKLIYRKHDKDKGLDYAILKTEEYVKDIQVLPIRYERYKKGEIISLGVGKIWGGFTTAKGEISGEYIVPGQKQEEEIKPYLIKIQSKELGQPGFSGAPIFSVENKAVIGIQIEKTNNQTGQERDTMLAFPLERMDGRVKYLKGKNKMDVSEYIEKDIWPVFAKMLLGLSYADNLEPYINCVLLQKNSEKDEYVKIFSTDEGVFEGTEKKISKFSLEIKMMKVAKGPAIYVFKNEKCYELGKGGKIKECTIEYKGKQNKINDENDRVAILAVEIIHKKQVVGALVIEFFETLNEEKDISNIMENQKKLGDILYHSAKFANQILGELLSNELNLDVEL